MQGYFWSVFLDSMKMELRGRIPGNSCKIRMKKEGSEQAEKSRRKHIL